MIVKETYQLKPGDYLKIDHEGTVKRINCVVLQRNGQVACRMVDASWEIFQHRHSHVNVYNHERNPTYRKVNNEYRLIHA